MIIKDFLCRRVMTSWMSYCPMRLAGKAGFLISGTF